MGDAGGGVEIASLLGTGAGEVDDGAAGAVIDAHRDPDAGTLVQGQFERSVAQPRQQTLHGGFRVVLHEAHISQHRRRSGLFLQLPQQAPAQGIGRELGLQIGDVLVRVAGRMGVGGQPGADLRFQEAAIPHDRHAVGTTALLVDMPAAGGHGTGADAAHVGMVGPGGDEIAQGPPLGIEDGGDHGDVGQVGAAGIGRVDQVGAVGAHGPRGARRAFSPVRRGGGKRAQDGAHRIPHAAQVHRDMGGVGDEVAPGVEQGAGEVQALADVDRAGGVPQGAAHVLGDAHEAAVEQAEPGGVGPGSVGAAVGDPTGAQEQVAARRHFQFPAGFQHQGGTGFHDQGRAPQALAGSHRLATVQGCFEPLPGEEHLAPGESGGRRGGQARQPPGFAAALDGLRLQGGADQGAAGIGEAETQAVLLVEGVRHGRQIGQGDGQERVGTLVAQKGAGFSLPRRGRELPLPYGNDIF